ncbi:MAG: CRTAC1 family protein, partial [Phycisphaerae bacterium]|nr:CRTAC1 family protein [Phycisphaerae bacterium]
PQTPPGTRPLRYTADTPDGFPDTGLAAFTVLADVGPTPRIGTLSGDGVTVIDPSSSASAAFALPFGEDAVSLSSVDLDNDRRLDLIIVERNGRLHIAHPAPDGAAAGWRLASTTLLSDPPAPVRFVLPWDYEPDGDLDLLLGHVGRPATLLRNNGDGTFQTLTADAWVGGGTVPELTDAAVADWDEDGDVDLIGVTADDAAVLLDCERSGRFAAPVPLAADAVAVAAVDLDNDGWIDLAYRTRSGGVSVVRNDEGTAADPRPLAAATTSPGEENAHRSIIGADADNDGWIDLFVRAGGGVTLLRNRGADGFTPGDLPGGDVRAIAPTDLDADGDLDLVVQTTAGGLAAWTCEGTPSRGWQLVRLESILDGGQRNNAFAVGGTIELRAGRQYQKRVIDGPVVHFGLGDAPRADAIRVLWPNGVPQNIVLPAPNQLITEEQELKGSCPFLLAFDGERERFVTDLLWRSPVGMKINAQVVAPIGTTRDHVKIESHQLVARDGRYDLTITAALWETIFFDEITLLAVDHPDDILFHIDERFSRDLPPLELHTVDRLRAPRTAIDHRGRDVLEIVRDRDGRRLGDFARGPYQGVAEMHHVELDLGAWDEPTRVRLFASGWIMPTDTSINVALGQGTHPAPSGIAILVADGRGGWIEAIPDAGFPSGKLKTIVLELTGLFPTDDHRIRVRTNLEIYWDRLAVGLGARAAPTPRPLRRLKAELGRIGFPVMRRPERTTPEWPDYTSPTQTPRWRDLVGWYTRYGDVEELVARTDDRFVIMNAGDAIRLSFQTPPPPPPGWTRSFILTSDGWVKDGDLNTVDSRTVAPLPYHGMTAYPYPPEAAPPTLRPSHADWSTYHTRIVTPEGFRDRLRRAR